MKVAGNRLVWGQIFTAEKLKVKSCYFFTVLFSHVAVAKNLQGSNESRLWSMCAQEMCAVRAQRVAVTTLFDSFKAPNPKGPYSLLSHLPLFR